MAVENAEGDRLLTRFLRRGYVSWGALLALLGQPVRPLAGGISADQAVARADGNSRIAHGQLVEKARMGGIDLYFEGDSIVRRWGAIDYPDLLALFDYHFRGRTI